MHILPTAVDATLLKGEVDTSFEHCWKDKIGLIPYKLKIPTLIDLVATALRSIYFFYKINTINFNSIISSDFYSIFC